MHVGITAFPWEWRSGAVFLEDNVQAMQEEYTAGRRASPSPLHRPGTVIQTFADLPSGQYPDLLNTLAPAQVAAPGNALEAQHTLTTPSAALEMSMPYVYPQFAYTPYLWPYFQQPTITPFIPPSVPLPPSPSAGAGTRRVHFDDDEVHYTRPRAPSFYSGMVGTAPPPNPAPFPSPPFVYTPLPSVMPLGHQPQGFPVQPQGYPQPPHGYTHHRRRSDSVLPAPAFALPAWVLYPGQAPAAPSPPPQLNPLLSAEYPNQSMLLFDLSLNHYDPQRISQSGQQSGTPLSRDELSQVACWPGVTRMVITCDEVPDWKVILEPYHERPSNTGYLTVPADNMNKPITVNDVLFAIHKMFQRQIRHRDWVSLSNEKSMAVARAYTRRCRTFSSTQAFEESQGVRRVDYLEDRFMFKGLVRHRGERDFENLRLLVGKR
ncbi:hypothetical protein BC835DRAFT_1411956 [Cytidiella melzeri]|nr:hypothetical protein BC835DRAFT_1411956 [Cytidiella melzeri]